MQFVSATASGFVPASHENPRNPGVLKRVIATSKDLQVGQVQMLNWASLPAGSSFSPHYHEDMQEVFVLISGHVVMNVDGLDTSMQPGDTIIIAPREVHRMTNVGEAAAEYLVFGISSGQNGRTIVMQ